MRTRLRSKITLLFMTCALLLTIPAMALASDVNVNSVVDVTTPNGAATLQPGQSENITINMEVRGNQDGTGTFEVYRDWQLQANGTFVGSNPEQFTVDPQNGGTVTPFSTTGTVSVPNGVPAGGPHTLKVGAFAITNTNQQGAKLSDGRDATYSVTVVAPPPPSDTTAPIIDYTLTPGSPDGANGWYKSDVALTWNVTDSESSVTKTGCVNQNITADQAETTYSCSATSDGGSAGPVEVKIKRDGTAPVITDAGAKSIPDGAQGWYITEAFNKFTSSDSPSGLADTTKDSFEVGTGTDEGADLTVESGPVSDKAGNTAASETSTASFNVDLSNPHSVAFVGDPAAGSSHYFGSLPSAEPTCTAEDEVSGLENCEVKDYSTAVGTHTMTATAADKAGRTATTTRTYTVDPWTMKGFYQPVDMTPTNATSPVYNTVKGGSTVPFKFEVFAGSTELTDPASTIGGNSDVKVAPINCDGTGIEDAIETTATGGTVLRYDSTAGQFVFNWQTPKKPGTCYKVTIPTKDGVSSLSAHFKFK
jgi:hypothetical protein